MHPLLRERRKRTSFAREDRQVSFGPANISRNQHYNPPVSVVTPLRTARYSASIRSVRRTK